MATRATRPAATRSPSGLAHHASILVIDDDPDVRGFIVASLAELGHRVREASDGPSGLDLFAAERPDLVVIDFIMPGLSGADVARHILDAAPDQRLAVRVGL